MKIFGLMLLVCVTLSACATTTLPAPTPTLPAFSPVALAQTTNAPTPTLDPRFTRTPTATPQPTSTESPATQVAALDAPAVIGKIALFDLPGEGRGPAALARLGSEFYVANRDTKNLAVVQNDKAVAYITLGLTPSALVADSTRNRIYAGTSETPTLLAIENRKITNQVAADGRINALAVQGDDLYVALDNDPIIERFDAATLKKKAELRLSQGFSVGSLVVDAPRKRLYAGQYGRIVALDLENFRELFALDVPYLIAQFAVNPKDGSIWSGAYDEASSRAYVVGYTPEGKQIARLFVGADLTAAAFDDANKLYVLDRYNNQLYVVSTPGAELAATIPMNEAPSAALYDAARKVVLVSNSDSDNLAVVNVSTQRVVNIIPLAPNITALVSNPQRRRVYAASGSTNSVFVIENDKVVGQVPTGNNPVDLAIDPAANRLYVAASGDGTLTVIDEASFGIRATEFITRFLSTVAADAVNKKLFAGSYQLDPETLKPQATFFAKGLTLNSQTVPQYERVNPALQKIYAVASNGVPGSNSRLTLFRFLYDDLNDSSLLGSKNGGNTTALAIDPTTNNLYATNTHPLAYTHGLDVFDAQDNLVQSLALASRTSALVVNPETHHLFLAHALTYQPIAREPAPRDDTVEILDTRTLGIVATVNVPNAPWRMTLLDNKIYVASLHDGTLTIIGDAATQKPPAPTPTLTLTPFPTWTPAPNAPATPTAASVSVQCSFGPPVPFAELWLKYTTELGCPTDVAEQGNFAVQTFKDGFMFDDLRDPHAQKIYVLFPDQTYAVFADTWREGDPERPCNEIKIPEGRIHPKRGFGKVWCEHPEVQAKMPGAVADESGITLTVQNFEHGMMWANTPQGVITLFENGTWR
jgi:DNA-binding beta-propeller fold protein YncE